MLLGLTVRHIIALEYNLLLLSSKQMKHRIDLHLISWEDQNCMSSSMSNIKDDMTGKG